MSKKILIAEDDESIIEVVRIILEDAGYTVHTASTSDQFSQKLDTVAPDLLLLDIWLSGEDGGKIARDVKGNPKTAALPIIIVSANAETAKIAHEVGADDFLLKPFDIEDLLGIVLKHIEAKHPGK